jgi:hypothetical protein
MAGLTIKFSALIFGIVAGFIMLRLFAIDKPIFYKWPHPENAGKIKYKDKNGLCYEYESETVDCATNKAKIKPYPIQVAQTYLVAK